MVLRYHTEYHIIEAHGHTRLQVRVVGGHSLSSHIMMGWRDLQHGGTAAAQPCTFPCYPGEGRGGETELPISQVMTSAVNGPIT